MKPRLSQVKYPAIQRELEQLSQKYERQKEECLRMMQQREKMIEEEKELDDVLAKIKMEIKHEENNSHEIMEEDEEEEAIEELENQIAQNDIKIQDLEDKIRQRMTLKRQWEERDQRNRQILQEFPKHVERAEKLAEIQRIMKDKKRLCNQLWSQLFN